MFLRTFSRSPIIFPRSLWPLPRRCRITMPFCPLLHIQSQMPYATVEGANSQRFSTFPHVSTPSKGRSPDLLLGPPTSNNLKLLAAPPAYIAIAGQTSSEKEFRPGLDVYNGKSTPIGINVGDPCYLIHGIRHHQLFAFSAEVTEFCSQPGNELYARARNARLIMSNIIPEMPTDAVTPYCIWYPDVAIEKMYRELSQRYPRMRYQVGRACAVAGYDKLYDELQLLPDVSIAEEAEDNNNTYIRDSITNNSVRYAVMNDYTRTINIDAPREVAGLNGDTAVRSSLEKKRPPHDDTDESKFLEEHSDHYFDIQEDYHVRPSNRQGPKHTVLPTQYADLLYKPLPRDLPPVNKDILILMAAWDGNIDRYSRLRRPYPISNEISAVIRGAYHHTPFARWLEGCVDDLFPDEWESVLIRQAIHARFIMNDDLSRVDRFTHGDTLPEFFWWPHCPHEDTLREFAWRRPDMKHQIALACIVGQYQHLFDELIADLKPTQDLLEVAYQCPDKHYRKQVNRFAEARGVEFHSIRGVDGWEGHHWARSRKHLRPRKEMYKGGSSVHFPKELINRPDQHDEDWEEWYHPDGELFNYHMHLQFADWQIFISAKDDARESLGNTYGCLYYLSADDLRRRSKPGPAPPFPKKFDSDEDDSHRDEEHFEKRCAIPSWKRIT